MNDNEKIFPLPVKSNKNGTLVKELTATEYYRQISEEVLEAYKAANNAEVLKIMHTNGCGQCAEFIIDNEAEELVDIITCCITRLELLGYDEDERQKLYQAVNEKNRKRGYFED